MFDYIIIGAGQAGLSMAYHLKQQNANFIVLDSANEIGASWLSRWDSLKLFTPTEFNHLPGLEFPAPNGEYPDKHDVANYFKSYVKKYDLPIQLQTEVKNVVKKEDKNNDKNNRIFEVTSVSLADNAASTDAKNKYHTKKIIIASGPFHTPFVPPCSDNLSPEIMQLHSSEYRNPQQLNEGDTMVVGAGDSGFQILKEIAENSPKQDVYFSGRTDSLTLPQEWLGKTLWWWFDLFGILSISKYSWFGKKIQKKMQPVIGIDIDSLMSKPNITPVGHTLDAEHTTIECKHATLNSVKNIVWATGFKPDFSWLEGIELDKDHYPVNYRGVGAMQGMYFVGLPWMYTRGSATLGGVQKDAEYLYNALK